MSQGIRLRDWFSYGIARATGRCPFSYGVAPSHSTGASSYGITRATSRPSSCYCVARATGRCPFSHGIAHRSPDFRRCTPGDPLCEHLHPLQEIRTLPPGKDGPKDAALPRPHIPEGAELVDPEPSQREAEVVLGWGREFLHEITGFVPDESDNPACKAVGMGRAHRRRGRRGGHCNSADQRMVDFPALSPSQEELFECGEGVVTISKGDLLQRRGCQEGQTSTLSGTLQENPAGEPRQPIEGVPRLRGVREGAGQHLEHSESASRGCRGVVKGVSLSCRIDHSERHRP